MDCCFENYNDYRASRTQKNNHAPVAAGNVRFLFGLLIMFAGLYIATLSNLPGHGLGFLMVFSSPFILLTDRRQQPRAF